MAQPPVCSSYVPAGRLPLRHGGVVGQLAGLLVFVAVGVYVVARVGRRDVN